MQNGTLCYHTEPLPLDSLLAAHGRINTDTPSVKSLLKIVDKRSTQGKTVDYPSETRNGKGEPAIFNWFANHRRNAASLVTLPHPLDTSIEVASEVGQNRAPAFAPHRETAATLPTQENSTLHIGGVYIGRVTSLKSYGAFVDLGNRRADWFSSRKFPTGTFNRLRTSCRSARLCVSKCWISGGKAAKRRFHFPQTGINEKKKHPHQDFSLVGVLFVWEFPQCG